VILCHREWGRAEIGSVQENLVPAERFAVPVLVSVPVMCARPALASRLCTPEPSVANPRLTRRFPAGATEEEYELTTDAANAIRFITTMLKPRVAATESRLAVVMLQLTRLAEETDSNPKTRLAALVAERERIDREIESVQHGGVKTLPDDRALERIREIIGLELRSCTMPLGRVESPGKQRSQQQDEARP
jgi:hypothetical protein